MVRLKNIFDDRICYMKKLGIRTILQFSHCNGKLTLQRKNRVITQYLPYMPPTGDSGHWSWSLTPGIPGCINGWTVPFWLLTFSGYILMHGIRVATTWMWGFWTGVLARTLPMCLADCLLIQKGCKSDGFVGHRDTNNYVSPPTSQFGIFPLESSEYRMRHIYLRLLCW